MKKIAVFFWKNKKTQSLIFKTSIRLGLCINRIRSEDKRDFLLGAARTQRQMEVFKRRALFIRCCFFHIEIHIYTYRNYLFLLSHFHTLMLFVEIFIIFYLRSSTYITNSYARHYQKIHLSLFYWNTFHHASKFVIRLLRKISDNFFCPPAHTFWFINSISFFFVKSSFIITLLFLRWKGFFL